MVTNDHGSYDVVSFGEVLVDWVSTTPTVSFEAATCFEKFAGGAPANVSVALARLGNRAAFIGGVSDDPFGVWLRTTLMRYEVDVSMTILKEGTNTRMAYVLKDQSGDRRLAAFTQAAIADAEVTLEDVQRLPPIETKVLHYGSVSMAVEPVRSATISFVHRAKEIGQFISFDPNVRLPLWSSAESARRTILPQLSSADFIKVSEEELNFLSGTTETKRAMEQFWTRYRPALLAVTAGDQGAQLRHESGTYSHPGFEVSVQDTTGAGDAFVAAILDGVVAAIERSSTSSSRSAIESLQPTDLENLLERSCAVAAMTTRQSGAIPAMIDAGELERFLENRA